MCLVQQTCASSYRTLREGGLRDKYEVANSVLRVQTKRVLRCCRLFEDGVKIRKEVVNKKMEMEKKRPASFETYGPQGRPDSVRKPKLNLLFKFR